MIYDCDWLNDLKENRSSDVLSDVVYEDQK